MHEDETDVLILEKKESLEYHSQDVWIFVILGKRLKVFTFRALYDFVDQKQVCFLEVYCKIFLQAK